MSRGGQYDWVTDDLFDGALENMVGGMSASELLAVPGVYEALSEALNNDVLDYLTENREKKEGEDEDDDEDTVDESEETLTSEKDR